MSLIAEWEKYASQDGKAYTDRFANLFREHHSPEEIERIFAFSRSREIAVARMAGFFAETVSTGYRQPAPRFRLEDDGLIAEARQMLADAARFLDSANEPELAGSLRDIEDFVIEDSKVVRTTLDAGNALHAVYFDTLGDAFGDRLKQDRRRLYPLDEAAYQLTTSFDVTRYLISSLLEEKDAFNAAYRFWRGGGDYCVMDGKCLISHR
ncbi:MAG: hypothetical protein DI629_16770 [Mesorhizobium amorphae]|nr:MAG: hypothetical protein DI629_16770 [Mesorhizobium amorphae]